MQARTINRPEVSRTRLLIGACTHLLVCIAFFLSVASSAGASEKPPSEVIIAADRPGHRINVELIGNASRLPALLGVSSPSDLREKLRDKRYAEVLRASIRARFPGVDRIRIGNLFFGYSCASLPFQEMATRDASGSIVYQFDETLDMLELLIRTGIRPVIALTGTPRALVPEGEEPLHHSAYGCINAPALDLSKREPRDRADEWWKFQAAFFNRLRARFGEQEIALWEFATWSEPTNKDRDLSAHLVLPENIIEAGKHDEAVATIIAASIDAAMHGGVRIHIGNFAGNIEKDYPSVITKIRAFPRGPEYLDYIVAYAVSRYRSNPRQDIGRLMDSAIALRDNPVMPRKPLFIDELGQLADDTGGQAPPGGAGLVESSFIASALQRVFDAQDRAEMAPRRVALWNTAIPPRARSVVNDVDGYVPSATTNIINFFKELEGDRKLPVSGSERDVIAGVDERTISLIVLGKHRANREDTPHPIRKTIKITGLAPGRAYVVNKREVSRTQGNAISAFVGGDSHLDDPGHRFRRDGRSWRFATGREEQCFFDEIVECSWRSKGRQTAIPKKEVISLNTDRLGSLEMTFAPDPGGAILATIELR